MIGCSYPLASCILLPVVFRSDIPGNDWRSEGEHLQGAKRNRGVEVRDMRSHAS